MPAAAPVAIATTDPPDIVVLAKVRRALLLALVVATPLVMAPSFTLDQYNLPKLALLMVLVPVVIAIRCVEIARGTDRFRWTLLRVPVLAMAIPLTIAWLVAPHPGWSLWGEFTRLQGLIPYLIVIALGVLLFDAFHSHPTPIAWAVTLSGAAVGAVATYQMLFSGYDIPSSSTSGYVTATLGHSNFAGGFLGIALPVAVALWLRGGRGRWPALVASALIADGLLFTFSQGGWAAGVAGVAVAIGIHLSTRSRIWLRLGLAGAAVIASLTVGLVMVTAVAPSVVDRYPALESIQLRGFLWRQAVDLVAERPVAGWGPNAFSLEAPSRRVEQEAVLGGVFAGDDPHSVPLAIAVGAGALGVAGMSLLVAWLFTLWRRIPRYGDTRRALSAAFTGGAVAYGVQALVSLDEIALRSTFWACLVGLACLASEPSSTRSGSRSRRKIAPSALVAAVAVALALWSAMTLVPADHLALTGAQALRRGDITVGAARLTAAFDLRDAMEYRRVYAESLGEAAVDAEEAGRPLIQEMERQYRVLAERDDPHAARNHARYLHAWSLFDPSVETRALALFEDAVQRDPYNPVLATQLSDVLINLGRPDEAVEVLRRLVPLLTEEYPRYKLRKANQQFWGALAIAEAQAGNPVNAREAIAISEAAGRDDCRTWIAMELLKPEGQRRQPPGIGFLCPRILLRLLPPADV